MTDIKLTPKQKADELFSEMTGYCCRCPHDANSAAIVCVDAIIASRPMNPDPDIYYETSGDMIDEAIEFWKSVRQELETM